MNESRMSVFSRALDVAMGISQEDPAELFADDVRGWSPAVTVSSLAELRDVLKDRDEALSNVTVTITGCNAGGNKVVAEWRLDADHTGPLEVNEELTVDATGRHIHFGGATFAEFRGDKIHAFRSYFDDFALLEQLLADD